ncbi:MAG: PCRF domain-containing protein, partial [Muribaculaceae bacterium]|nr:PCRF domain-containing protein [Muribaculaceae bacterium]
MEENPLLSRLDGFDARFEEVATLITDPAVIADQKRYVRLTKEYHDLEKILQAERCYRDLLANVEEAKAIVAGETDEELRAMAREELEAAQSRIPKIEEEIKMLLVPADPEDSKNAVVEIRGGTGGDEAALFAGDLFRMYQKYAEKKGWNLEVTNTSEGASGGYKEICFNLSGADVYGVMKYESGVHRVQRVPATETQ